MHLPVHFSAYSTEPHWQRTPELLSSHQAQRDFILLQRETLEDLARIASMEEPSSKYHPKIDSWFCTSVRLSPFGWQVGWNYIDPKLARNISLVENPFSIPISFSIVLRYNSIPQTDARQK
jgi:hypothetical protein